MIFLNSNVSSSAKQEDTLSSESKEIIITSTKFKNEDKYISQITIGKTEVNLFPYESIVSSLKLLPNLNIIEYGGLESIKSANIRGFNSKQTSIAINGFKVNNNQSGIFDLNLLNIFSFDQIIISNDGNSSLQTTGGMGGTIDFNCATQNSNYFLIASDYYFYGAAGIKSSLATKIFALPFKFTLAYQNSSGKYPIEINEFGTSKEYLRQNAQANLYGFWLTSNKTFDKFAYNIDLGLSNLNKGIPGAIIQGNLENTNAKYQSSNLFSLNKIKYFDENQIWELNLGLISENSEFKDANIDTYQNLNSINSLSYLTTVWDFNLRAEFSYEFSNLESNALNHSLESINRNLFALSANIEKEILSNQSYKLHSLFSYKQTFIENYDFLNSYFVGLNINNFSNSISYSLNFSKNHRIPSFNELYFKNYGNQNLKPEQSNTLAFKVNYVENQYVKSNISLDLFLSQIKDYIISVPRNAVIWSTQNVAKVQNWGFGLMIQNSEFFTIAYSLQFPIDNDINSLTYKKLLAYQNNESISAKILIPYKEISSLFALTASYKSHRFYSADNDYYSLLKPYTILDFAWNFIEKIDNQNLSFKFEIFNILNTNYEVIRSYPMPLRNYKFTFEYKYD